MIVTSDSLRKLQQIAAHDSFRKRVRELSILPILFEDLAPISYAQFTTSMFGGGSELEARYETYHNVAADHQNALKCLPEVLESCVSQFENLDVFKLQPEGTEAILVIEGPTVFPGCLGLRQLKTQLSSRRIRSTHPNLAGIPETSISGALVLSALLKAILASGRMIRELHTCAKVHCGVSLSSMTVTSAQYRCLLPLMREAECLHLCPRGQSQQSPSCEAFLDFVVASARKIKVLCLSHLSNPGGSRFPYFPKLAGGVQFAQLQELHLFVI